ncbi:hypothetical protein HGRIS_003223 [Hohenbuehelia grisea]|uniref:Uncharacterized protein n=1 Tax=Hohenbuehelia grisea TaxID=104357 RepID=A0ABR3JPZ5_9AGAR
MSSSTILTDTLPFSVPRLESSRKSWPIFALCFLDADPPADDVQSIHTSTDGAANAAADSAASDPMARWDKNKRMAKALLTQKLPNSALMLACKKLTVHERWRMIEKKFTWRGTFAQTHM